MVDLSRIVNLEYEVYVKPQSERDRFIERLRRVRESKESKEPTREGFINPLQGQRGVSPFPPMEKDEVRKWIPINYRTNCKNCMAFLEVGSLSYWMKKEGKTAVFCTKCAEDRGAPKDDLW